MCGPQIRTQDLAMAKHSLKRAIEILHEQGWYLLDVLRWVEFGVINKLSPEFPQLNQSYWSEQLQFLSRARHSQPVSRDCSRLGLAELGHYLLSPAVQGVEKVC